VAGASLWHQAHDSGAAVFFNSFLAPFFPFLAAREDHEVARLKVLNRQDVAGIGLVPVQVPAQIIARRRLADDRIRQRR